MSLQMSRHAGIRMLQRGISRDAICLALCGWQYAMPDGSELWLDRPSRTCVVVEEDGAISTVMRLQTKRLKRMAGWRVI